MFQVFQNVPSSSEVVTEIKVSTDVNRHYFGIAMRMS